MRFDSSRGYQLIEEFIMHKPQYYKPFGDNTHVATPKGDHPRYVVCAACKWEDIIVCAPRHFDMAMRNQINLLPDGSFNRARAEQGFVDQYGNFMSRTEALHVVLTNNQPLRDEEILGGRLFSENLY